MSNFELRASVCLESGNYFSVQFYGELDIIPSPGNLCPITGNAVYILISASMTGFGRF